jgi:hypothetical protein
VRFTSHGTPGGQLPRVVSRARFHLQIGDVRGEAEAEVCIDLDLDGT